MSGAYEELQVADVVAYGVNDGTASSHARFREKLSLPFELLVDDALTVSADYNALKPDPANPAKTLPRIQRTVYVVGKNGLVVFRKHGAPPVSEILAAVNAAGDD